MYLTTQGAADLKSLLSSPVLDKRRHRRFPLSLAGRFMRANREEFPCQMQDISVGGIAMLTPEEVEVGERIVAYFDQLGGVEGKATRLFEGGFAISLKVSAHKRAKLAAQITWFANKEQLTELPSRANDRIAVANKFSTLTIEGGQSVDCKVLDFSLSGASVGTELRPPIGSEVHLGKLRAKVMRYHSAGIGLQFLDIISPEAVRRYFG